MSLKSWEKLTAKVEKVWNKPVDPAKDPRFKETKVKPVTREDLGTDFRVMTPYSFNVNEKGYIEDYKDKINFFFKHYNFGSVIHQFWLFIKAKNFKEVVDYIAEQKLYLNIFGYVPSCNPEKEFWAEYKVPNEVQDYLLKKLGKYFIGWENGEQDGRYISSYAQSFCPHPAARKRAYQYFLSYFGKLTSHLQNYLSALNSLTFQHYFAEMGVHRIIGAEIVQALPSVPMWFTFIRGAGKQYSLLWFAGIAVYDRWGAKVYEEEAEEEGSRKGPNKGPSISLLKRLWYVSYMYGSSLIGQGSYFFTKKGKYIKDEKGMLKLSPIGEMNIKEVEWSREHSERGVQYTPVALLFDFFTGWVPPRHLYSQRVYLVWGNMHYTKGDHQIDVFYREVFPGYEDSGYYHNERGYLTPTPYGDIFDVLLSNTPSFVLNRYNLVILLGEIKLKGELLNKVKDFVENGGSLILSACQVGEAGSDFTGVEVTKEYKEAKKSYNLIDGKEFEEDYFYQIVKVKSAEVLAVNEDKYPLITQKKYGKGKIIVITPEYGLGKEIKYDMPIVSEEDNPLPPKYKLLKIVKHLIFPYIRSFNLVDIEGESIQYITNLTKEKNKLILTLCNNEDKVWKGEIKVKGSKMKKAKEWMSDEQVAVNKDGTLEVEVPSLDLKIFEIVTDDEFLSFKEES